MKKIKTVKDFVSDYFETNKLELLTNYPGLTINTLIEHYCEFDNSEPTDEFRFENDAFLEKIKSFTPLEYINFHKFIFKDDFYVNPDVLIPRFETEILIEDTINYINKNLHINSILDLGTGSGVIGLSVAKYIQRSVHLTLSDISDKALEVARVNYDYFAEDLPLSTKVEFVQSNLFTSLDKTYDLIVSNPPYIKAKADKDGVHHQTITHEPHLALFIDDEAYAVWFENYFEQCRDHLNKDGVLFIEGHEDHLKSLAEIAKKFFNKVELKKDYTQRIRFLYAFLGV